jgi:phenylalanyl-tRNA synthetase beta chain
MKISYNWLKWYMPEAPEAGKLADILTYHLCEVENLEKIEDDVILDIKILPNRAHDLLSHQGVAREIASLLNIKYLDPTSKYKIPEAGPTELKIKIESEKCRRYMGRIVRNVKVGYSTERVVKHLESIGQRSINNIVDAANLVMFDCGQPTHAFDLDKVRDAIIIREAKDGENITTLDNRELKFKNSNMVIADSKNVLAIAGIKGGKTAEVDNNTKNIILEIANFDPTSVRKTAQSLNIITDAKKRFENDLSPELGFYAMRELSGLIHEILPEAMFEDIVDVYPQKQAEQKLSFSVDKVSSVLGLDVSVEEVKDILRRYNFIYSERNGEFEILVPVMRMDLVIPEDMAEEIGRIIGYDKIKGKIPKINFQPKQNETYSKILWTRNKLLNEGYSEVMNSSFRDKGEVSVLASASDKNFLRTNLTDGLKESFRLNQLNAPLLGINKIKIFEIGTVFKKDGEEMHVAYNQEEKIIEMNLEKFAEQSAENSLALFQSSTEIFHQHNPASIFHVWSLFPFIARDIAVWVPKNVSSEDVAEVIRNNAGNMMIKGPELFDEFKKEEKISYAFRIIFQSYEKTLTDDEINEVMKKITEKIEEKKDWQVR